MRIVGIIAEYNPLHSGHQYHIRQAKKAADAEGVVCVLSSSFVQRGEPAFLRKHARALMALNSGADLVLELPAAFSCASAEYFSGAAVGLLNALGCVDVLSFGSEEGSLPPLLEAASLLASEPPDFKLKLKDALSSGLSFPAARQKALSGFLSEAASRVVESPNNILAVEYLKALKRLGSGITPSTLRREGQGYNDTRLGPSFSSATAIRSALMQTPSSLEAVKANMPEESFSILTREQAAGFGPVTWDHFETIVLHRLRTGTLSYLAELPYMGEGLHYRLKEASFKAVSIEELISLSASSRYPSARIRRILCALITGMTQEFLNELKENGYVRYLRVLGFNAKGREILAGTKKKAGLPFLIRPADYKRLGDSLAIRLFEHEIHSTDTYALGFPKKQLRKGGLELTTPLISALHQSSFPEP